MMNRRDFGRSASGAIMGWGFAMSHPPSFSSQHSTKVGPSPEYDFDRLFGHLEPHRWCWQAAEILHRVLREFDHPCYPNWDRNIPFHSNLVTKPGVHDHQWWYMAFNLGDILTQMDWIANNNHFKILYLEPACQGMARGLIENFSGAKGLTFTGYAEAGQQRHATRTQHGSRVDTFACCVNNIQLTTRLTAEFNPTKQNVEYIACIQSHVKPT